MSAAARIRLVPAEPEHLAAVLPWFDDPEGQRWLGGRAWPERELALRAVPGGDEFRGRTVLRSCTFVALDLDSRPVGQIGGDVYDRWTVWDAATQRVLATHRRRTMGAAYVVDPRRHGQGYGRALLRGLVAARETADVEQFVRGIEPGNTASLRAAAAAGFEPLSTEPDAEDMLFVRLCRPVRVSASGGSLRR